MGSGVENQSRNPLTSARLAPTATPRTSKDPAMARKTATTGDIVKLKVTLQAIRPPVWRRLLIPAGMTLRDLHDAIQTSMGWEDAHLHDFDIAGDRFGDPGTTDEVENEARLTLAAILKAGVGRFKYTYDFGDDWEHLILVEGTVPRVERQHYPACIAGKRACPPEDCGGPYGYANLLEVRADPAHPDHEEMSQWLDEDFDPDAFSVADTDARLAARFGPAAPPKR
jgi:Plasmid pRiA4b ORF-3-like protein